MIEGFDKEIDLLLRQTAQGEVASVMQNPKSKIQNPKFEHLDADEISAFAENALPEKIRQKYILHLADCDKCRNNLSNLILLNAETPFEIVDAKEKQFVVAPIPWYRKIFAFSNLAYTMGGLILMFAGIAVYTILQNDNSRNAEVSQTYEKQPGGKGMSSDGDTPAVESYSNKAMSSNSASMNSAANSSTSIANSPIFSAPWTAANANAAINREDADKDLRAAPKPMETRNEPGDLAKNENSIVAGVAPAPPPPPQKETEYQIDGAESKQPASQSQSSTSQKQITELPINGRNTSPLTMMRADRKAKKTEDLKDDAQEKSAATATVGGKIFKRANNVWYDSAYRGQPTTNISRGTKEYKKLDSGLRGIVENLGGTIVIVWKEKAYRIQ